MVGVSLHPNRKSEEMNQNNKSRMLVHCCIAVAVFYGTDAVAQGANVDVCHIPPGNPENAHTITISENAVNAHLDHGDQLGACESEPPVEPEVSEDPEPTIGSREPNNQSESACACPRKGVWRVTNLEGHMECNVLGIKRPLRGADRNDGAIWILDDDCSTVFAEAYEKDHEDVLFERGRECTFFGMTPGEEDGAEVLFDLAWKIETEEFIAGESYLKMSSMGANCSGFRPFEINFLEPLSEKDYARLEEEMQKKLEIERAELIEYREQIDEYLEETDGGQAFGGRNGQE